MFIQEHYPTYLTLAETEEMEGMSVINLLKFLEAEYVDVWYNTESEECARYVYENYVLQVCFSIVALVLNSFILNNEIESSSEVAA